MKMYFDEVDVRDSLFVYEAKLRDIEPEQIDNVDLFYNKENGFSAITYVGHAKGFHDENDVIRAVACYLSEWYSFDSSRLVIQLLFDETKGFSADITVTR